MAIQLIARSVRASVDPQRVLSLLQQTNAALNHDFCPSFNRWVYWVRRPFWCLVLAIGLSGACGVFLSPAALYVTAILILLAGTGVAFPWLAMKGIEAHLTFDHRRGRVGGSVPVRLRIRNRWPWPVWGLSVVRGFTLSKASNTEDGVALARVPGWSTIEYSWQFVPKHRGRYPLAAAEVETGFPFGLFRASRPAAVDGHVIVWPKTVSLAGLPDAAETGHAEDQLTDRRAGDFGDMLGTRLFRQGDSLRRVHWAQTARQQQLIVCERQAAATSVVRVTLDLNAASHAQCDPGERREGDTVELVVQVAASVCESLHRQHCRVELWMGDQMLVAGESVAGFQRLMDTLSQAALETAGGRLPARSGGFGIFITTPAGLRSQARQMAHQHVIMVSDDSPLQQSIPPQKAWIAVTSQRDIATGLSVCWKGACNVR
jgi:uncharacterized protein (DUF58 family)